MMARPKISMKRLVLEKRQGLLFGAFIRANKPTSAFQDKPHLSQYGFRQITATALRAHDSRRFRNL